MKDVKVTVTVSVSELQIQDILTSAFEGGSNWCEIMGFVYPPGMGRGDFEFPHIEVVMAGGQIRLADYESDIPYSKMSKEEKEKWTLTYEKLVKGLQVMADKYPNHFAAIVTENDDATTADVFLQCCLFGEIVYG